MSTQATTAYADLRSAADSLKSAWNKFLAHPATTTITFFSIGTLLSTLLGLKVANALSVTGDMRCMVVGGTVGILLTTLALFGGWKPKTL